MWSHILKVVILGDSGEFCLCLFREDVALLTCVDRVLGVLFELLGNYGVLYCNRYGAIMKEMLEDLERHRNDKARRVVWLQLVTPQFESMGIVLVAQFKRLLPLLYYWLHAQDETTQILVFIHFLLWRERSFDSESD